jgi:hypothetical protein
MILAAAWRRIRIPRRCHLRRSARYTECPSAQALHRYPNRLVHLGVAEGAGDDFAPRSWPSRSGFRTRMGA